MGAVSRRFLVPHERVKAEYREEFQMSRNFHFMEEKEWMYRRT